MGLRDGPLGRAHLLHFGNDGLRHLVVPFQVVFCRNWPFADESLHGG